VIHPGVEDPYEVHFHYVFTLSCSSYQRIGAFSSQCFALCLAAFRIFLTVSCSSSQRVCAFSLQRFYSSSRRNLYLPQCLTPHLNASTYFPHSVLLFVSPRFISSSQYLAPYLNASTYFLYSFFTLLFTAFRIFLTVFCFSSRDLFASCHCVFASHQTPRQALASARSIARWPQWL